MKDLHKNNYGFAHIGLILLAVLAITAIGGGGDYVATRNKTENTISTNQDSNSTLQTPSSQTKDNTSDIPDFPAGTTTLNITEARVRLTVPYKINDLTYEIRDNNASWHYIGITTKTIQNKVSSECDIKNYSPYTIGYFTNPNEANPLNPSDESTTYAHDFPNALHVGNKYFYLLKSNGQCDPYQENGQLMSALNKARLEAIE